MEMTVMWKTQRKRFPHYLGKPYGFPTFPQPRRLVFINPKSVTYVSEHLLPMSPVKTHWERASEGRVRSQDLRDPRARLS